jgi:hypothetical protein
MKLFLKETMHKKQIPMILFIIITVLLSSYSVKGAIHRNGYKYTTGKNPAVAASQFEPYFVEVHEVRGKNNMDYTVLGESKKLVEPYRLPCNGWNPAITYMFSREEFAVVYCTVAKAKDENSKDGTQSISSVNPSKNIALTIINPSTKTASKPKIIIKEKLNLNPSVAYITTGKYMGCLAVMVGRPNKDSLSLAIVDLNGNRKLTADLGQSGRKPAITLSVDVLKIVWLQFTCMKVKKNYL